MIFQKMEIGRILIVILIFILQYAIVHNLNYLILLLKGFNMNIKEIVSDLKNDSNFEVKTSCGYPKLKDGM